MDTEGKATVPSATREGAKAETADRPAMAAGQGTATKLELGRGLDVGTANLASEIQDADGYVTIKLQRNAFIDIEMDDYTRNMLTRLNVQYVVLENRMIVVGDAAFELANIFNRETRRPMKAGVVSPGEKDALPIERMLLENLLGGPQKEGEVCYFSVPAQPIDSDFNVIYHQGVFDGILKKLGYRAKSLVEGHAVVFSELAEDDFTGIGISCGGGMFNVCVAYKSIPALSFSTSRGGDWIDRNVANVLGIKASRATAIKERGVNLLRRHYYDVVLFQGDRPIVRKSYTIVLPKDKPRYLLGVGTPARAGRVFRTAMRNVEVHAHTEGESTVTRYVTPIGSVQSRKRHSETLMRGGIVSPLDIEHLIKGPEDYRTVAYMVEHTDVFPTHEDYLAYEAEIGRALQHLLGHCAAVTEPQADLDPRIALTKARQNLR